jgi:hypothetical protein
MYGAVAPLVQNTHLAAFGINQSNQMNEMLALHLRAITAGGEQAEEVAATLRAAAVLAANALKQSESQLSSMRGEQRALAQIALATASATLKSLQVEVSEREVTATAQPHVGISSTAIALLVPAIESARIAAQRTQSMNNLRQIALAMHNYAATYGHFPPAVVMGGPNNDVPHSWRVAILPFLEEQALYNAYRKEEPWDSEHNKSLLSRMPEVYRSPSSQHDKFASSYYVFTGPATIFAGSQGTGLAEITDGTSATLLAVEAERDIPWTKPEDIPYDSNRPLPQLGGLSVENGILAARADGSVQVISQAIDEQILRRLIEKADGQSVGF